MDTTATMISIPSHVAIVMDGNGRWAEERGWTRTEGHRAGLENIRKIVKFFSKNGVKYLTLFAFSTENWDRPNEEVKILIELLEQAVREETKPLHDDGVRIRHIGRLDRLPVNLRDSILDSVALTSANQGINLNIAYDYGSRTEIVDAVKRIVVEGLSSDQITEDLFSTKLYTSGIPDPDFVIRTAGEMRLSNFLMWQCAYAEFYTTKCWWPDFDEDEASKALEEFSNFTLLKRTDLDIFVLGTAFGISVYTGGLLSFAVLLRGLDSGLEWVIVTSITVFATDTAALYFGKIFGRTPLAPEISPSKTLEGAVGGIFCSVLIITVSLDIVGLEVDIAARLILGVTIGLCAQLGDLFESWMKRTTGVKDSGSLIPGHGGVLDRLDSIIPNLAIVYSFVTWGT